MQLHFGCIFKATVEYATGVRWALGNLVQLDNDNGHCILYDLGGEKHNPGHDPHSNGHGHVWIYAQLCNIERAMNGPDDY